jgi:hypothetical protein
MMYTCDNDACDEYEVPVVVERGHEAVCSACGWLLSAWGDEEDDE